MGIEKGQREGKNGYWRRLPLLRASILLSFEVKRNAFSHLCLDRPAQDRYQLFQFRVTLFRQGLIDGIAFQQILLQYLIGPNAELCPHWLFTR